MTLRFCPFIGICLDTLQYNSLFFSWARFESSVKPWLRLPLWLPKGQWQDPGVHPPHVHLQLCKESCDWNHSSLSSSGPSPQCLHLSSFLQKMSYIFQSPPVANLPSPWDCPHLFPIGLGLLHQLSFPQPLPSSSPSTPCWETPARNIPFTFWI